MAVVSGSYLCSLKSLKTIVLPVDKIGLGIASVV